MAQPPYTGGKRGIVPGFLDDWNYPQATGTAPDIENKLHWSLDVTFNEDRCRIRRDHAPANIAAVRHIALNLLRQEHTHQMSLRWKRLLCSLDEHYLLTVLSRAT